MKYSKAWIERPKKNPDKVYTAKDVVMVRVTMEFPVSLDNLTHEALARHIEAQAASIEYQDSDELDRKALSRTTIESSPVTAKDLKSYYKDTGLQYIYNPNEENDLDILELK